MKKALKGTLSAICAAIMLFAAAVPTLAKTGAYPGNGDVICAQEGTVQIAKSGADTVRSYALTLNNTAAAGSYEAEAMFEFSALGQVPSLIKLCSGEAALAQVMVDAANNLKIRYSTATDGYSYTNEAAAIDTGVDVAVGTTYTVKLAFSLDSRELFAFVNGNKVCADAKLYIGNGAPLTAVATDPAYTNTESTAAYGVSSFKLEKKAIDIKYREQILWEENFESYNASQYHSASTVTVESAAGKDGAQSMVWHAKKGTASRLLLDASSNSKLKNAKGIIETSVDFKFNDALPTGTFDLLYGMSADRNNAVYRVYANGGSLYLYTPEVGLKWNMTDGYTLYQPWSLGSPSIAAIEKDKWYTLKVCADTESKRLWVYLDDVLCNADKTYFVKSLGDCATILNINHNSDYQNGDAYYDNYKCVLRETTGEDGFTVIERNGFNSAMITHSETANSYYSGVVQFGNAGSATIKDGLLVADTGAQAIGQMSGLTPITEGTYTVSADFKFERLNTASEHNELITAVASDYGKLAQLSQLGNSLYAYVLTDYRDNATRKYMKLIDDIDTQKWYNIGYRIDFKSGRIRYYVNGVEVNADVVMYVPTSGELKLLRPLSVNANKSGYNGKVLVDNFVLGTYTLDESIPLEATVVKSDVTLPTTALNESISYTSSNDAVLSAEGRADTTALTSESYVTLTAKVPVSGSGDHRTYLSKEFTFIVRPDENRVTALSAENKAEANADLYKECGDTLPTADVAVAVFDESGMLKLLKFANTAEHNNGANFYKGGLNVSVDTASLPEGSYTVKAFAFDKATKLSPIAATDSCTFTK